MLLAKALMKHSIMQKQKLKLEGRGQSFTEVRKLICRPTWYPLDVKQQHQSQAKRRLSAAWVSPHTYWMHSHTFHFPNTPSMRTCSKHTGFFSLGVHITKNDIWLLITAYIPSNRCQALLIHIPPPLPLTKHCHTHSYTHMRINTLFPAGLRGWIISRGATCDGERGISSCALSLCLLESFRPIRSHWWRLERHHKWVDKRRPCADYDTIPVTDTQTCDQTLLCGRHKLDLMLHQLVAGKI